MTSLLRLQPYCIFLCSACISACLQVTGIVLWLNHVLSKTEKNTTFLYLLQQSAVSAPSCKPLRDHVFADALITPLMDKSDTGLQGSWPLVGSLPTTWVTVTKTAESGWTLDGGGQTWHKTKEILTHHVYFWDRVDTGYVDAHSYDDWRTWGGRAKRKIRSLKTKQTDPHPPFIFTDVHLIPIIL